MFSNPTLRAVCLGALILLAGCGKKTDLDAPLAFVPADTPYVYANVEPLPEATLRQWSTRMQAAWPTLIDVYTRSLTDMQAKLQSTDAAETAQTPLRVLQALLEEVRERDSLEKWTQLGLDLHGHTALYGVGLVPVLRVELSDADAFRAMVTRVESASGAQLGHTKVGDQDVWTLDLDKVRGLLSIQGKHLVASVLPQDADDALTRRVLGLTRPASSLAENDGLQTLNSREGYLGYGSGWIDFLRIVSLIDADPGYQAFAGLFGEVPALTSDCRADLTRLTQNAPRLVYGYTRLDPLHLDSSSRLDLEPSLAAAIKALAAPPPGSASALDALYDVSVSFPVLKYKQFLIDRANAMVATPFRCEELASWNETASTLKSQLTQTVPPPFSDFTGLRLTLNRFDWPLDGELSVDAKLLLASSNPATILTMAQLALPELRDIQLGTDGATIPLPVPASLAPDALSTLPEIRVGMSATGMAFSTGGEDNLSDYLNAPAATDPLLARIAFRGAFYGLMSDLSARFSDLLPEEQRASLDNERQLYVLYQAWLAFTEVRVVATDKGIEFQQVIELTP